MLQGRELIKLVEKVVKQTGIKILFIGEIDPEVEGR